MICFQTPYSSLLHVGTTSELAKDASFLEYDFKEFGLWGNALKSEIMLEIIVETFQVKGE
jgi:hypothetical protein